jgi:hypothetical protein
MQYCVQGMAKAFDKSAALQHFESFEDDPRQGKVACMVEKH